MLVSIDLEEKNLQGSLELMFFYANDIFTVKICLMSQRV